MASWAASSASSALPPPAPSRAAERAGRGPRRAPTPGPPGRRPGGPRPELVPRALVRLLGNGRRGGGGRSNEPGREESATGLQHDLAAGREVAQELLRQRGGGLIAFGEEIPLVVPEQARDVEITRPDPRPA